MMGDIDRLFKELEINIKLSNSILNLSAYRCIEEILKIENSVEEKQFLAEKFEIIAEGAEAETAIYLYSIAISFLKNERILLKMLKCALTYKHTLGVDNVYYIYQQACNLTFRFPQMDSINVIKLKKELYHYCLMEYFDVLKEHVEILPKEERSKDLVVMIAQQVIGYQHGPTKSALSRCKALIDSGYKVLLINTAELIGNVCSISYYDGAIAGYCDEYLSKESLEWSGVSVPFFQCENNMPNYETFLQLINAIKELKPAFAISVATGTIFEGILSKIIPVLGIPMSQSELFVSGANWQTYSGKRNESFFRVLEALGLEEKQVIFAEFGFSILEQGCKRNRKDIGASEKDFILVTVGGRLDNELDDEFWNIYRKIVEKMHDVRLLILGPYHRNFTDLNENIISLGYVEDVLSYMGLCNLYINPHRKGGGTSCIEAMANGLPVLTDDFGDVSINAGTDFCVSSYDEYISMVQKCHDDVNFYKEQSCKAKKRAEKLLNSDEDFLEVIKKFLSRSVRI